MEQGEKKPDAGTLSGSPQKMIVYAVIAVAIVILAVVLVAKLGYNTDLLNPAGGQMSLVQRQVSTVKVLNTYQNTQSSQGDGGGRQGIGEQGIIPNPGDINQAGSLEAQIVALNEELLQLQQEEKDLQSQIQSLKASAPVLPENSTSEMNFTYDNAHSQYISELNNMLQKLNTLQQKEQKIKQQLEQLLSQNNQSINPSGVAGGPTLGIE
jgi:hypothetical protein